MQFVVNLRQVSVPGQMLQRTLNELVIESFLRNPPLPLL